MMKLFFVFLATLLIYAPATHAQAVSPEQFLGYSIGSRYTPHHKIVDYFKSLAASSNGRITLKNYGTTNGGRPLMYAVLSSAANMNNISQIKTNNLQLATGKVAATNQIPIVWLSYNVHGDEPSSSEAAMLTAYKLLTDQNAQPWLNNTVVIIDPCLNPDGRDRYVQFYNDGMGRYPNANLDAAEHQPPWPGGRLNHYLFDLNRDWAWQTQTESKARIIAYREWMPQVHVDFHEQDVNSPYYFAPAAEPYHRVITPWQREFQKKIGRNHARYFDAKGWLYFTGEIFDLLYPSYGDTYPMFNGAIGMTYEQGGGAEGGLAAIDQYGDTLTLTDRVMHHTTTGLSTVETASQEANTLIKEFKNYFTTAINGDADENKFYVIKNGGKQKMSLLMDMLRINDINFSYGSGSATGYNYNTGKVENFSIAGADIIVPCAQPQSRLARTLLEPQPIIADSLTYDITAWALPYAYGLQAYSTKQNITINNVAPVLVKQAKLPDAYAYVFPWETKQSVAMTAALLQKNIRVRFAEKSFTVAGKSFDRGSIIILNNKQEGSFKLNTLLDSLSAALQVDVSPLNTGLVDKGIDFGSSAVHYLRAPKVMLLTGEETDPNAVGEVWNLFDNEIMYPLNRVTAQNFNAVSLADYDVIILANGFYSFLKNDNASEALQTWVSKGGRLVALEGAASQLSKLKWSRFKPMEAIPTDSGNTETDYNNAYERRERDYVSNSTPGAIFRVNVDNSNPLMYGYPNYYFTLKRSGNTYKFFENGDWNAGYLSKEKPVAGFVGSKLKNKLEQGLLFGVQEEGRGKVVYLTDDVLFRSFWENGKLMFCNAVFMVGQ